MSRSVFSETSASELVQLFPTRVGSFQRVSNPTSSGTEGVRAGEAEYSRGRERFLVQIARFQQDNQAYAVITFLAAIARSRQPSVELNTDYGTTSFAVGNELTFFKGVHVIRIFNRSNDSSGGQELAHALSDLFDKGEGEIPALVKHLPNWEQNQKRAMFFNRVTSLQDIVPNQTVLGVLDTEGDADATFADTGSGKVLIIEYHTPQLAKDNDERIIAKIHELWKLGQPAPIGYRRVGNYSVFVFDAPDEATAKQLIDQVKYEQVVQWLGDNPNILKEAQRRYVQTTLGVFIAVLKASGFALVACLGLGGLIGALLFSRRRARQTALEAYSDAGGMLRLNLDQMTPQTDPARLLGPGH